MENKLEEGKERIYQQKRTYRNSGNVNEPVGGPLKQQRTAAIV